MRGGEGGKCRGTDQNKQPTKIIVAMRGGAKAEKFSAHRVGGASRVSKVKKDSGVPRLCRKKRKIPKRGESNLRGGNATGRQGGKLKESGARTFEGGKRSKASR